MSGTSVAALSPTPMPEVDEKTYPGLTIDEVFPIVKASQFSDGEEAKKRLSIQVDEFEVTLDYFTPQTISHEGKVVFRYTTPPGVKYWANLVGQSQLLGPRSSQIYMSASGPGGVCCTNYWITDISAHPPRSIFRSVDFGEFRGAMEIFDADGDGIYELVQFDSCMRYFRDNCGSCSPEPRVYFKYDPKFGGYRPARGIIQHFVIEHLAKTEQEIEQNYVEFSETGDLVLAHKLNGSIVSLVADLLHLKEEKRAWALFERFDKVVDEEDRRELRRRLSRCKFYQALSKDR